MNWTVDFYEQWDGNDVLYTARSPTSFAVDDFPGKNKHYSAENKRNPITPFKILKRYSKLQKIKYFHRVIKEN